MTSGPKESEAITSRLKQIIRPMYSNPPINGARIVDIILRDKELTTIWHKELIMMSDRIREVRHGLV